MTSSFLLVSLRVAHRQVSYDATKGRYIVQLTAKAMNDHTSLAPKNVQQIVYGAVILRGFRSRPAAGAAGAEDGGSTSTMNLAGKSCRVVGSNVEGVSADSGGPDPGSVTSWEHLVELNDDKEGTPLEELTRLQPDAIKLPVRSRACARTHTHTHTRARNRACSACLLAREISPSNTFG